MSALKGPGWPSERGWYSIALFVQTHVILAMLWFRPDLTKDEFFKSIATAIVITGWIGFAIGQRGQQAATDKALDAAVASNPPGVPQPVVVANDPANPVPVDPNP